MKILVLMLLMVSCISNSIDPTLQNPKNIDGFLWLKDKQTLLFTARDISKFNEHAFKFSELSRELRVVGKFKGADFIEFKVDSEMNLQQQVKGTLSGVDFYAYADYEYTNKYLKPADVTHGVRIKKSKLEVKFWSPLASEVSIEIYDSQKSLISKLPLSFSNNLWVGKFSPSSISLNSFDKLLYRYEVAAFGITKSVLDPYTLSMASFDPNSGVAPFGVIINTPKSVDYKSIDNLANGADFIGMEFHVRDATISATSEVEEDLRGTYLGFAKMAKKIKKLGVTHVQLHPLQNFYTVDEDNRAYQDENTQKNNVNYNWGYDPHNYFSPEGWYSTDASDPYKRISELQSMNDTFHQEGMGVILDVVYNHLFDHKSLESVAPYMRRDRYGVISMKSGAGASLESRNHMTRKIIIDSLLYWKNTFKFDGFRFDLMGFTDTETMVEIRKALGPEVILYGEAWEFTDLPRDIAPTKSNLPKGAKLAAFNDTSRDSYTGHMSDSGFIQGNLWELPKVRAGIIGSTKGHPETHLVSQDAYHLFAESPLNTLNYLTIHDGFTLWDKINLSTYATDLERQGLMKMALAMLFTSQGKVMLHGGVHLARSKPLQANDPNPDRAHTSTEVNEENGVSYFHENTYKSPDKTNEINWARTSKYSGIASYVEGLAKLKRHLPALRLAKASSIKNGIKFYGTQQAPEVLKNTAFNSFKDPALDYLVIEFINAPASLYGKKVYLAGEIHPNSAASKNPRRNGFSFKIDNSGIGELRLTRAQIHGLDLDSWSDPDNLQLKIVKSAGKWDSPIESYSTMGNNTIKPSAISASKHVTLDLSIINHTAGERPQLGVPFVAYEIDNTLESASRFAPMNLAKVFVAHNTSAHDKTFRIQSGVAWKVFVDSDRAGVSPLSNSTVKILGDKLIVPAKSSTVIGF